MFSLRGEGGSYECWFNDFRDLVLDVNAPLMAKGLLVCVHLDKDTQTADYSISLYQKCDLGIIMCVCVVQVQSPVHV